MRLLITTDTIGGVWTFTSELTAGLLEIEESCEITLVSLGRTPCREQLAWAEMIVDRARGRFRFLHTDCPLEWMPENAQAYSGARDLLLDCVRRFSPHLIHSNQFCFGTLPAGIPTLVTAHSDVFSWWRESIGGAPEPSPWIETYRALVAAGLEGASMVAAPTRWMLQKLEKEFGSFSGAVVIANGRDIKMAPAPTRKRQAVTAGRIWDQGKNVRLLSKVRSSMPLYAAGETSFEGNGISSGEWGNVRLTGSLNCEKLLELFSESSIYIITSRYEPFGLSAVEAALTGCAIVANDIPSLREVWGDGAIYFSRNDADSLARILDNLGRDEKALRSAAARSGERAKKHFSRKRMAADYLKLYRGMVEEHRKAPALQALGLEIPASERVHAW